MYLFQAGSGPLVGICRFDGTIITASKSGIVTAWKSDEKIILDSVQHEVKNMGKLKKRSDMSEEERTKHSVKLSEGKELSRMRQVNFKHLYSSPTLTAFAKNLEAPNLDSKLKPYTFLIVF